MADKPGMKIEVPHPTPAGTRIYHWHGGLLLLARTLVLERPTRPIAATLRIALKKPYTIEVENQTLTTRASLVGSKMSRKRVVAIDSDVALFYLPIERPEYAGLRRLLGNKPIIELSIERLEPVLPRIQDAFDGRLEPAAVKQLSDDTLQLISEHCDADDLIDPRIHKACEILATTPLNEFSLEAIAEKVHLSPSRLRGLFKQQIGHPIGEYARWAAIWQSVGYWTPKKTFTEAGIQAGFFDLAHIDKAFVEVFGMSPSLATDSSFVTLINCD